MKIALIITSLGMGGAERQVCDLADQFADIGHQVLLVSLTGKSVCLPSNTNIQIEHLCMHKSLLSFLIAYTRALGVFRSFSPDVVHSHMIHANLFARLLRLTITIPRLICTIHSTFEGGKLWMLAYRLTDSFADLTTNVSEAAVRALVEQGACKSGRMIAIYNGIDIDHYCFDAAARDAVRGELKVNKEAPLLVSVGRLEVEKDYPNLLRAFSMLATDTRDARLAIIGAGKLHGELIALAGQMGIEERVHFMGLRGDVEAWMSAADIFVLSSAWEGFGLVVAEAMACECTVVATDCGGVREVIGEYGMLVEPGNSKALSLAMKKALSLPKSIKFKQGKSARAWIARRYAISSIVDKWLSIYQIS